MIDTLTEAKGKNVGFISTRLAGTDGVSLETAKWAKIFKEEGYTDYYMAGELDTPPDRSYLLEEAHFSHPEVKDIYEKLFRRNSTGAVHHRQDPSAEEQDKGPSV